MKDRSNLSLEELAKEATTQRATLEKAAEGLVGLYEELYRRTRRQPSDDLTAQYINLSNAGRRFAASVIQGLKRTAVFDRNLQQALVASAEAKQLEEEREVKEKQRLALVASRQAREKAARERSIFYVPGGASEEDLIDLYGEG